MKNFLVITFISIGICTLCSGKARLQARGDCSNAPVVAAPPGAVSNQATWKQGYNCTTNCNCSQFYQLGAKCLVIDPKSNYFSTCEAPYVD